jgi:hypothetical protein
MNLSLSLEQFLSYLPPTMLPLSFLIFIAHLVQAKTSQSVVTRTEVVSSLIPPYATYNGPGSATYYASIVYSTVYDVKYAMTCLPPSNLEPEEVSIVSRQDPCQTKLFGTGSQTIFQAKSGWDVTRTAASGRPVVTQCQIADPFNEGPFTRGDKVLTSCSMAVVTYVGEPYVEPQDVNGDFGMERQVVTITGGFEETISTSNQGTSTLAVIRVIIVS